MEQNLHDGPFCLGKEGRKIYTTAGLGSWSKGMASAELGARDVFEFRAALQPLVDGILVKTTQRVALRKQLGWPSRCHSMLWSERDAFGVPSRIQDSQLHCEAADGDLVKSHHAVLNLAALCLDNVVQSQPLEVKAAGPACSGGSPRKRAASAGGQIFLHAAPIQEQTVLGLCGNYGNRTRGPLKTHRAKNCSYGRRTLGPYKSHWATRNYGNRTQGPMKSLRAQKCEGRRAREPVTGPSGPPSIPTSSPCPHHGWNGGQNFTNDGKDVAWSNPLQVVLERRPSACDLVPSAQPAYVSDVACLSGLGACASTCASVQPAIASDAACPAPSAHVNESSLTGAPLPLEIVQEATAMEANVPQAGKPSIECVPRRVAFGLSSSPLVAVGFRPHSAVQPPPVLGSVALGSSSPPSVALGFSPDSAAQPPLVLGTVSDSVFSLMLPQVAEPMHNVNPSRVAPSLTAPEGWLSTSQAAPSEVLKVSAATPEYDCKDRASTLRAALSEVPEVSAATLKHDCKVCVPQLRVQLLQLCLQEAPS